MPPTPLARVRSLCRALPGAHEVEAWGEPTFRIKNKIFAMYGSAGNHHGQGRPSLWCMATPENQELMVRSRPERFFVPPYVGPSGWIGIYLDRRPAWTEVRELLAGRSGTSIVAVETSRRSSVAAEHAAAYQTWKSLKHGRESWKIPSRQYPHQRRALCSGCLTRSSFARPGQRTFAHSRHRHGGRPFVACKCSASCSRCWACRYTDWPGT